jgi:hypothetical protein
MIFISLLFNLDRGCQLKVAKPMSANCVNVTTMPTLVTLISFFTLEQTKQPAVYVNVYTIQLVTTAKNVPVVFKGIQIFLTHTPNLVKVIYFPRFSYVPIWGLSIMEFLIEVG